MGMRGVGVKVGWGECGGGGGGEGGSEGGLG